MNILIFNHYALTPDMGGGTRHFDLAKDLVQRGHKVCIVASSFHHASYQEMKEYKQGPYLHENISGVDFIWIKTKAYKGNGIARVFNMLDYMTKAKKIKVPYKIDRIIGSSVHLFAVYAAYNIAKKLKKPFVMEVRDIWPQTLIDMGMSKWHPFVLVLAYMEKFLYTKADKIISLLPQAYQHIQKFGIKKEDIVWISNGVDTSRFKEVLPEKTSEVFTVTYSGSMGKANALHTLMQTAEELLSTHKDIIFKLVGDGSLKEELISFKEDHNLSNVEILDMVSKNSLTQILKNSDILYLGLKDSPLYKFGMSMNKLFDYLAAEVPIVFASNIEDNPVSHTGAGLCIEPEDSKALSEAILKLYNMKAKERNSLCKENIAYIENNFSVQLLTTKLENLLKGLE